MKNDPDYFIIYQRIYLVIGSDSIAVAFRLSTELTSKSTVKNAGEQGL